MTSNIYGILNLLLTCACELPLILALQFIYDYNEACAQGGSLCRAGRTGAQQQVVQEAPSQLGLQVQRRLAEPPMLTLHLNLRPNYDLKPKPGALVPSSR